MQLNLNMHYYKLLVLGVIILNSSWGFSQSPSSTLKVMTYNIWNGFDWGKDTIRKANCVRWIKEQNPDVLALQELCGYTTDQLQIDAAKWGHLYVVLLKTEGYPVGLTSKKPISLKARLQDDLWHGMLHAETQGIDFFVVHLSPADCDFRFKEANIIAEKVKNCTNPNYIILGDFNAHSPFDSEALQHNQSLLKKYRTKKPDNKYSNLRLGDFDYSVMASFLAIPTIDVSLKFIDINHRYTFPAPALIGIYQTANEVKENKERIDYILTSPEISTRCTSATIYNNQETGSFSDHYPVMAEFNLNGTND